MNKKINLLITIALCGILLAVSYNYLNRALEKSRLNSGTGHIELPPTVHEKGLDGNQYGSGPTIRARIERILTPTSVEIQLLENVQGIEAGKKEGLQLIGLTSPQESADSTQNRLFARYREDFARSLLSDAEVSVDLEKRSNGELARGKAGELMGYLFLPQEGMYQLFAIEKGIMVAAPGQVSSPGYKKLFLEMQAWARREKQGIYGYPPPEITLTGLARHSGGIVTLRFQVFRMINDAQLNVLLNIDALVNNTFSVIIPRENNKEFTSRNSRAFFKGFEKQWVRVTGYLAEKDGKFQIRVYHPDQLSRQ